MSVLDVTNTGHFRSARLGDVMGFTFIVFLALLPVVLALVTIFALTLPYPL